MCAVLLKTAEPPGAPRKVRIAPIFSPRFLGYSQQLSCVSSTAVELCAGQVGQVLCPYTSAECPQVVSRVPKTTIAGLDRESGQILGFSKSFSKRASSTKRVNVRPGPRYERKSRLQLCTDCCQGLLCGVWAHMSAASWGVSHSVPMCLSM